MKKTLLFFTLFISLMAISCGDDDGPNFSEKGTWKLIDRSEVGDDGNVLDCEKLTTYKFSGNTVEATVYDPNEDESDCTTPESGTLEYLIDENSFLVFLDDSGNAIDTGTNIEIRVFDNEMKLVFRDPNDSPTSAIKTETFERQ